MIHNKTQQKAYKFVDLWFNEDYEEAIELIADGKVWGSNCDILRTELKNAVEDKLGIVIRGVDKDE